MKELTAEVTEKLRERGGEGGGDTKTPTPMSPGSKTTPTDTPPPSRGEAGQENRPLPPPVASKPKRKPGTGPHSQPPTGNLSDLPSSFPPQVVEDEVDFAGDSPSIPRSALDGMVLGVKVRDVAERPEMGSITEGLRLTAASGGR